VDKRGREYVVWKRYSRFDDLRSTLSKGYMKGVKDIPFPKKQKVKKKASKELVHKRAMQLTRYVHGDSTHSTRPARITDMHTTVRLP